jgi:hypothetical protein
MSKRKEDTDIEQRKKALFLELVKMRAPMAPDPDMLTLEEIERLKQRAKETSAYAQKNFRPPETEGEIKKFQPSCRTQSR